MKEFRYSPFKLRRADGDENCLIYFNNTMARIKFVRKNEEHDASDEDSLAFKYGTLTPYLIFGGLRTVCFMLDGKLVMAD